MDSVRYPNARVSRKIFLELFTSDLFIKQNFNNIVSEQFFKCQKGLELYGLLFPQSIICIKSVEKWIGLHFG
jgi:hypothetical protein